MRWPLLYQDQLRAIESDLRRALDQCAEQYGICVAEAWQRLTNVPPALLLPDGEANEVLDLDAQASLFRASQRRPAEAERKLLHKKQRRAARKLAAFLDTERLFPRQRPAKINARLALYLVFAFEELIGRKLPFSRPAVGGTPRGPAFSAVLAALALVQARAQPGTIKLPKLNKAGLASIIEITRTEEFDRLLGEQGFERTSADVFAHGNSIALTIALARKSIIKARGSPRKKQIPTN